MKFAEELWRIAPPFLKRTLVREDSDLWIYLQTLAGMFDQARLKVFEARRQALVPTASGVGLDRHGEERKTPRYPGEEDESYRQRLLTYQERHLRSGTKRGMLTAMRIMGYPDAVIYPLYKEKYKFSFLDGNRTFDGTTSLEPIDPEAKLEYLGKWSQLLISLTLDDQPFTKEQSDLLLKVLNELKPPEGKIYALLLSISVSSFIRYQVKETIRVFGQYAQEFNPKVSFMNGRRTMSADPLPLVLDGAITLDSFYKLEGYKEWPVGTWIMKDDRNSQSISLSHQFSSFPEIVVGMDGRYWLNGKLSLGGARKLTSARAAVKTTTATAFDLSHAGRDGYRVVSGTPKTLGLLNAYYRQLDGAMHLDGYHDLAPDRMLDGREQITSAQAAHRLAVGISFSHLFGHGMDMSVGLWYMDGGGSRYSLDGRIMMSPLAMLDGSIFLNGQIRMEWLASLGDSAYRLDNSKKMGGDGFTLDGQTQLGARSSFHTLRISTYKNSRLVEKEVV